ncbi:MAG: ATP-binding cassette domain-containing protein [Thermoleophilia bacterium]|nr:ATP-binding cassette domain-containing protein [Thermoleophilia bacterium]
MRSPLRARRVATIEPGTAEAVSGSGRRWASVDAAWYPRIAKALVIVVLMVWPIAFKNLYALSVMTTAGLFAMLTVAVGIILGQAGQLSFGHSAFYGMGAYVAGLLSIKLGVPTLAALFIGAIVPGIIALIVGRPVLRLRLFYLALATIGLGQIFIVLVIQLQDLTGGINGFAGVPLLSIFGFKVGSFLRQYYVVWIPALIILLLVERGLRYRFGRSLRALATSEIASSTLGIRTANWKLLAFVVSAVICGFAGGLFAFMTGSVSPYSFMFTASILPIVMGLIGGTSTIWGGVLGAILMTWLINYFTVLQKYSGVAYSLIMLLFLLFLPAGILGLLPASRTWLKRLFKKVAGGEAAPSAIPPEGSAGDSQGASVDAPPDDGPEDAPPQDRPGDGSSGPQPVSLGRPLLQIEDSSVAFGGLKAVDEVSFEVREGSITALIGPNGAGKTTLFNAISRHQRLTGGCIRFDGVDLAKLSPAAVARLGLARTFQNLRIFVNMSVLENVLVGRHRHERSGFWSCCLGLPRQRAEEKRSRARALEVLDLVGLAERASMPAASLPYGQQRLVEIARALASEPRLLLLDEPAAGMNASERVDLVGKIAAIRAAGVTVLLVEHDISLVMGISDAVNVLDHGGLIASGTPDEVRQDETVIEAYLGVGREQAAEATVGTVPEGEAPVAAPREALVLEDIVTAYGSIQALHGVSLTVGQGEVVAVLGANGAGKTTLLGTVSGILRPTRGTVSYQGQDITSLPPEKIVRRGICQVPEGRQLFPTLSVEDNLFMGASGKRDWQEGYAADLAYVYDLFPILAERRKQPARTLSGGEQQMLAIGRGLMAQPGLLLLDEPSMGLAPMAVERIFDALARLNANGLTMLMVEQNAEMALSLATRAAVIQTGSVVLTGLACDLRNDERLRGAYLGGR